MNHKYDTINNIEIEAHEVRTLKYGGYILVTLLHPFDEFRETWNMIAPNGDCLKVMIVDSFKSIAKFELGRR